MTSKILSTLLFSVLFISTSKAFEGDMYDFFLPNGMKVILMEKHAIPKVGLGVYYNVGSHDEKWGQKGINALMMRLIDEGTEKYPKNKLKKMLDKFSMNDGWWDNRDMIAFYSELPSDELEFGLDLESDRMQNVIIDIKKLDNIKTQYKLDLDNYHRNALSWRFNNILTEILPEDHPYKIDDWGLWEHIDSLSVQTCQQYYNQFYAPNNAILVIVGDINPENTTKLAYQYFGSIETSKNLPLDPNFLFDKNVGTKIPTFISTNTWDPMYQQWFFVNFFMPSSRNDDTMILDHLEDILNLEKNKNGPLAKKITKNRWVSDILWITDNVELGPSTFTLMGINLVKNVSPSKFKKSVLKAFKYIGENGIDNEILDEYKKSELLKFYIDNNDYSKIANRLGTSEIINGDYHFYNSTYELLENLTNEDIKRVVNTYITEDNIYMFELDINLDKKRWYTQLSSFIVHSTIFRLWNPFSEG